MTGTKNSFKESKNQNIYKINAKQRLEPPAINYKHMLHWRRHQKSRETFNREPLDSVISAALTERRALIRAPKLITSR